MIEIPKRDFISYVNERYKGLSFAKKIIKFFYPSGGENKKMRFVDFYKQINIMLDWSRIEQLGFCFYLFDYNNDGFICI
jgi:Ca2+-binding EF-hand superfamily protein